MALACEPELLIADEPTTALDVTIQAQVLMMIKELRNRLGTSMLMITHDLGIVAKICDDVAVMYAVRLLKPVPLETYSSLKKHHPYTEGLFGSIPSLYSRSSRLTPIPGLMPDHRTYLRDVYLHQDVNIAWIFAQKCIQTTSLMEHILCAVIYSAKS